MKRASLVAAFLLPLLLSLPTASAQVQLLTNNEFWYSIEPWKVYANPPTASVSWSQPYLRVYSDEPRVGVVVVYQTIPLEPGSYELEFSGYFCVFTYNPAGGEVGIVVWDGVPDFSQPGFGTVLYEWKWSGLSSYGSHGEWYWLPLSSTFVITNSQPSITLGIVLPDPSSAYWYVWYVDEVYLYLLGEVQTAPSGETVTGPAPSAGAPEAPPAEAPEVAEEGGETEPRRVDLLAMLEELRKEVEEGSIQKGVKQSLLAKVDAAILQCKRAIERYRSGDDAGEDRCLTALQNQLQAFIGEVGAQSGKQLQESFAEELIEDAGGIIEAAELLKTNQAVLAVGG